MCESVLYQGAMNMFYRAIVLIGQTDLHSKSNGFSFAHALSFSLKFHSSSRNHRIWIWKNCWLIAFVSHIWTDLITNIIYKLCIVAATSWCTVNQNTNMQMWGGKVSEKEQSKITKRIANSFVILLLTFWCFKISFTFAYDAVQIWCFFKRIHTQHWIFNGWWLIKMIEAKIINFNVFLRLYC